MLQRTPQIAFTLLFLSTVAVAQVADFTADVTSGCFPLTVKFTDTSTGSPTGWEWNFGNGNSSPLQNPSAVFSTPGSYTISLKASKGATSNTNTKTEYIVVFGPPEVNFSIDKTSGCAPLLVTFTGLSGLGAGGTLASYFWTFGDGGTSQAVHPTHTFQEPGLKTISLKVRNQRGCEQTKVMEAVIDVLGPLTEFTPSSSAVCTLPATITFTNNTSGQGTLSHQWNFGDGQTSTVASPAHTYQTAGGYDVVLTTTDGIGCKFSVSHKVYAGSDGGIDFTTSPDPVCPGQPITFTATSTDPIVTYEWTFNNGSTSTQISPTTTYTQSGVYQVTLRAQSLNHACKSVVTKPVTIIPPAVPSFGKSIDCNLNLFLASTSSNATRVEWYIDDVLLSTSPKFLSPIHLPGDQVVKLVAYNAAGCAYEKVEPVTLMSTPIARYTPNEMFSCKPGVAQFAGCAPFAVTFVNGSTANAATTYAWDFGDGSMSTAMNPSHTFIKKGIYHVKLTASNPNGCSTTFIAYAQVNDTPPVASFTIDKTVACPGEGITFVDTSQNADSRCWDFGDGSQATMQGGIDSQHVLRSYALPGTYTVTLTAKNGCNTSITKTNIITIKNPKITFDYVKTCGDPFNVQLTNLSSDYDDLHWEFGDGQTSTLFNPGTHHYAAEGNYLLKLFGTSNTTGCNVIAFAPLTIQNVQADFTVNTDKPCVGVPIIFTDKSHAAVKWKWSLGPHTSNKREFGATLFTPGNYLATLEVKDSDSCVSVKTMPIQVINMKPDFSFTATSTCDEFKVQFKDESTGIPPPTSWEWDFGDGFTSTGHNPLHAYTSQGKYNVVLHISNTEGSCTFTKEEAVDFKIPIGSFAIAKPKFCVGEVVTLANTSINASHFKWDLGDGRSSEVQSPEVVFDKPGSYTIVLIAGDEFGCEKQYVYQGFVKIVQPVADFSVDKTTGSCPPFTASFQDKSVENIKTWLWVFGDGKISTLQNPTHIYTTPGAYNVKLYVSDFTGCEAEKEVPQLVHIGGPSGLFTTAGAGSCTSQDVTFTATTTNTVKMTWDFGDGVVMDQTAPTITHHYNSTGTFTPSLFLTDANGCKVVAVGSSEIIVKDTTIITTKVEPACVFEGDQLKFSGETETDDELTWTWAIHGVTVGTGDDVETSLNEPGVYTVTGYAMNEFGCLSSVSTDVHVQGNIGVVPNVITPNGDLLNQSFTFDGMDHSEWDLGVIDRWGKSMYEEKNYKGTWDADDLPAGVYYFVLRNALCEGLDYKGVISVVR